ncbi:hypothetical protein LZ31DRAFT_552395 [Colletotrichum somersetense]|nr:hypothetical protein LZ31DRAFT_552395 [Colletotrichum somersetense]
MGSPYRPASGITARLQGFARRSRPSCNTSIVMWLASLAAAENLRTCSIPTVLRDARAADGVVAPRYPSGPSDASSGFVWKRTRSKPVARSIGIAGPTTSYSHHHFASEAPWPITPPPSRGPGGWLNWLARLHTPYRCCCRQRLSLSPARNLPWFTYGYDITMHDMAVAQYALHPLLGPSSDPPDELAPESDRASAKVVKLLFLHLADACTWCLNHQRCAICALDQTGVGSRRYSPRPSACSCLLPRYRVGVGSLSESNKSKSPSGVHVAPPFWKRRGLTEPALSHSRCVGDG